MPALTVGDRILVQTTTTGTGTYQLGAAVTGYQRLGSGGAGLPTGAWVPYTVVNDPDAPTLWEVVEGLFTAGSPDTLSRGTILQSSNGNSAINWGAGTRYILVGPSARRLALLDTGGKLTPSLLPAIPTSRLLLAGATSVPNSTVTYISYQTLVESSLAGAATVPTSGFTAPTSGSGRLTLNALMSGGSGGGVTRRAFILRDGAIIAQAAAPPSSEGHPFSLSWEGYVTSGQQFLAAVRQDSGGALQVTSSEFSLAITGG